MRAWTSVQGVRRGRREASQTVAWEWNLIDPPVMQLLNNAIAASNPELVDAFWAHQSLLTIKMLSARPGLRQGGACSIAGRHESWSAPLAAVDS